MIKLYYGKLNNFGDMLSPVIVEKMCNEIGLDIKVVHEKTNPNFAAIGSILQFLKPNFKGIIWGSGFMGEIHNSFSKANIKLLRGMISRIETKSPVHTPLGDPVILLNKFYKPASKKYDLGIGIKFSDKIGRAMDLHKRLGKKTIILNPAKPIDEYIEDITSCETVISSSLHTLIACDSFGIPNRWVKWGNYVNDDIKFSDYYTTSKYSMQLINLDVLVNLSLNIIKNLVWDYTEIFNLKSYRQGIIDSFPSKEEILEVI